MRPNDSTLRIVLQSKIRQKLGADGSKQTFGKNILCGRIAKHLPIFSYSVLKCSKSGICRCKFITSFVVPGGCRKWVGSHWTTCEKKKTVNCLGLALSVLELVEDLAWIKYGKPVIWCANLTERWVCFYCAKNICLSGCSYRYKRKNNQCRSNAKCPNAFI